MVLTNSQIDISKDCRLDKLNKQRETALKNGDIAKRDGGYFLNKSLTFTSPSSAACFVLGGSRNGWIEWKDQDGKTLDEIYRK